MDGMYAGFAGAKNRPNQIAATVTERQRYCWFEGRRWTEMSEKPGKVQALVVEFSADCAAIRTKSGESGYSEAVVSWRKSVYTSYTLVTLHQLQWRCFGCNHSPLILASLHINCSNCGNQYTWKKGVWECVGGFTPSGFTANSSEHLLDIEQNHFWFETRDRLLRTKLLAHKRSEDQRLLELGCGSGRMLATLAGDFAQTVGIEGHLGALDRAVKTCPDSCLLHGNVLDVPFAGGQFDWVVAFDVLEHVDPEAFLNEAFRLARPDGRLLLSVPAFPILWSYVDERAGHRCRYRLKRLVNELDAAGWQLRGHTYFQFLLFPLLAASRLVNRKKQPQLERKPPEGINRILRTINHLEINFLHQLTLPFGSSLIAWAEKPVALASDYD